MWGYLCVSLPILLQVSTWTVDSSSGEYVDSCPPSTLGVSIGETVSLTCVDNSNANDNLRVYWYFVGQNTEGWVREEDFICVVGRINMRFQCSMSINKSRSELTISNISQTNLGRYECRNTYQVMCASTLDISLTTSSLSSSYSKELVTPSPDLASSSDLIKTITANDTVLTPTSRKTSTSTERKSFEECP